MEEKAVFQMKRGQVLHLQSVSAQVLRALTTKMFSMMLSDPEKAEQLIKLSSGKEELANEEVIALVGGNIGAVAEAGERLFVYCAGWGISDDPPRRGLDEELLALLGVGRQDTHRRRAEWVRSLLADEAEGNALVKAVQELTLKKS
jgi:hypothetical protein